MSELISIIVPVFNTEKYLDKCVQSILGQTYSNIELLLIDDGSTDSSGAICDKYVSQDSRVKVFHKPNEGVSVARNLGLNNAKGEWIAFVDSDDWIDADMYEQMYNAAMLKKADMVCCDLLMEYKDHSKILLYNNEYEDHKLMYDCLVPISVVYFGMNNKLVSSKVYNRGKIRASKCANMWEDVELMTKVRYFSNVSCVINKPFYHYNRMNESSITLSLKVLSRVEGQVERVKQIEQFFIKQGEENKYHLFITDLKFCAKGDLLDIDDKLWMTIFPEARKDIWKINRYENRYKVRLYLLCYGNQLGIILYKFLKWAKSKITANRTHFC